METKVKKKSGPKPLKGRILYKKVKKIDARQNFQIISSTYMQILLSESRHPSYDEVAGKLNLNRSTIQRHLRSEMFKELLNEFKAYTPDMMIKLTKKAQNMRYFNFTKLWFELVHEHGMKTKVEHTGEDGKPIKQEVKHTVTFRDYSK